jgi:CRISPR-associated protein Cst1
VYHEETGDWQSKNEMVSYDTFKVWRNDILEKLLSGKSILANIARWNIEHKFPFVIVEKFQTIIKNMEKRTIDKIRQIADFIVIDKETDSIVKSIKRLNGEKSAHGLRQFIVKLNGENFNQNGKQPLITVTDYADYLFPDGGNWREVRDVLLIAIYENLHAAHLEVELPVIDDEIESEN